MGSCCSFAVLLNLFLLTSLLRPFLELAEQSTPQDSKLPIPLGHNLDWGKCADAPLV